MKRVIAVLMLLGLVGVGAYAVSGKIYARFNSLGPVYEYWSGAANDTDLWQGKDGTGFDINFDTIGVTYRTRPSRSLPAIFSPGFSDAATSPGYVQFRDIKLGPVGMSIGVAWWQSFGDKYTMSTNTNGTTNANSETKLTYNRFYIDYKFNLNIGDSIVIKQEDWDLMHFAFDFGSQSYGPVSYTTNTPYTESSVLGYIPLHIKANLGIVNLDLAPQFIFDSTTVVDASTANTNTMNTNHMRWGGFARVSVALADFVTLYAMGGYYNVSMSALNYTNAGSAIGTNTDVKGNMSAIPVYLGLMWKLAPGIKLTTGFGMQFDDSTLYTTTGGVTVTNHSTYNFLRNGYYDAGYTAWAPNIITGGAFSDEYRLYGDTFMDLAFLRFGADAKFAGNWSIGIAGGVGLNDVWTYLWTDPYQNGYTTTGLGTSTVSNAGANNLLTFVNRMNYDRQMYIKYEDEFVAIKGTIAQNGNRNYLGTSDGNNDNYNVSSLFGFFEYVDLTVKF